MKQYIIKFRKATDTVAEMTVNTTFSNVFNIINAVFPTIEATYADVYDGDKFEVRVSNS